MPGKLSAYHARRNFRITPEPKGEIAVPGGRLRFVVQKHHARKLHYDFRLELDGTLKSWAVPKGPSLDPAEKRLAVHVEDHPLDYIDFEGDIPEHQYGAGHVDVWDIGYWEPQGDPLAAYKAGKITFRLDGKKLQGGWALVRTRLHGRSKEQWLLIKERDEMARSAKEYDITEAEPDSVLSGQRKTDDAALSLRQPAEGKQAVFHGLREDKAARDIQREKASTVARVHGVKVTHPERVIDHASGLTKLDLVRFYDQVADRLLPHLRDRPVYLLRCPDGVGGEHFFQKHIHRTPIPGIRTLDPSLDPGHAPLMAIHSIDALMGAAQMGAIELHTCNATVDRMDRPDCMVFDLDPDPSLPWKRVTEGAQLVRVVLQELGLHAFLKTSGGKGLHLVVPLARRHDWADVSAFSQAVANHLATTLPKHFSAKMGEKNRVGKIFVDYLRNKRQASTVAPYSIRARPGLPVATPLSWDELEALAGAAAWTVASLPERLSALKDDPWQDYFDIRQVLGKTIRKKLGLD